MKPAIPKLNHLVLGVLLTLVSISICQAFTNNFSSPILACGGQMGLIIKADGTLWTWDWNTPQREPSILGAVSVAAGDNHSMVLKWDGRVFAWGANDKGQLGINNTTDQ